MNTFLAQATVSTTGDAGGASPILMIVWLVVVVALIAALWKIFTKAGKPGWISIIPIWNTIALLQITGKSGWWILGMMVPFLNLFVAVRLVFNLATVFGRGMGFGFGLLFLSPIFLMILGFGNAVYVGPSGTGTPVLSGGFAADSKAA